MGRQQYLTRLALGRSAFEPIEDSEEPPPEPTPSENGRYIQQYDSKGRPNNPRIEAFNAEMRKAQNDVLALVGVVEKKDLTDRVEERRTRYIRAQRTRLLQDEQEKGELLDYAFLLIDLLAHLWADAFIQRIQIGFYDPSRSMTDILSSEWRSTFSGGLKNALALIFPGFGDIILHTLIRLPLIVAVEQLTGRIQNLVQRQRFKRPTRQRLYNIISVLFELTLLGIDIALLPIEFHARAQRLGLAPPLPLIPSWKSFLPWHSTSFHRFGWNPIFGISVIKYLTAPAVLLLIQKILHWDADDHEIPIGGLFTNYRFAEIDQGPDDVTNPKLLYDPAGWVMHQIFRIRTSTMTWCGWDMYQILPKLTQDAALENNSRVNYEAYAGEDIRTVPTHRSTALAHLPAQRLALSIDTCLSRLITLPFESLMLRSVAHAFLYSSPFPKTAAAIQGSSHIYTPIHGSPISHLLCTPSSTIAWTSAAHYISRLGISLAIDASVHTLLFLTSYLSTRHLGLKYFLWGPPTRDMLPDSDEG